MELTKQPKSKKYISARSSSSLSLAQSVDGWSVCQRVQCRLAFIRQFGSKVSTPRLPVGRLPTGESQEERCEIYLWLCQHLHLLPSKCSVSTLCIHVFTASSTRRLPALHSRTQPAKQVVYTLVLFVSRLECGNGP